MADFLRQHGRRAVAVHSGETSAPRAQSLDELSEGGQDVICAVDVFNEGLDLPELDTNLMLRPTESRILWLQQFGRGLRKKKDDKPLTVIDSIGNHRTFLLIGDGAARCDLDGPSRARSSRLRTSWPPAGRLKRSEA
jgi:superfamily II DNA or RNA helicase